MSRERRLWAALVLNSGIVIVQAVVGLAIGSLGLLADAGHNLTDVAAMVVSLVAVRLTARPPTARRSFGWHRSTILAAQANAAAILAMSALIAFEAVGRFGSAEPLEGGVIAAAALLGLVGNSIAAAFLHEKGGTADLNMRSAMLHAVSDAASSAGVFVAGLVMVATDGWFWLDPAVSLLIAAVIAWRAVHLLVETAGVLLESTPAGLDTDALTEAMATVDGVESVHDLHVWSLSSDLRAMAAHLVLDGHPSLEEAQLVGDRVRRHVRDRFHIAHATLELECEPCAVGDEDCGMDPVLAESARHGHAGHQH